MFCAWRANVSTDLGPGGVKNIETFSFPTACVYHVPLSGIDVGSMVLQALSRYPGGQQQQQQQTRPREPQSPSSFGRGVCVAAWPSLGCQISVHTSSVQFKIVSTRSEWKSRGHV